ncbi:ribonuclease catalytic domain-containing protein [Fundidesulfovibrio soli]|uniref:ribonuclease catalytic domain-containing protein n=1 Tax=Fundidesulfovibrio soli TaxID=2922716 RepID=UPI001FAEFD97|nr:ribonuclease catalytic domain-containing protein [Fundidesulfovibrio soli]
MTKHPSIQSMASAGCIVEFLQGNEPQLAWVEQATGDKLHLFTLNKRESKLAASRILPWIGPRFEGAHNRESILEKLREHSRLREELAQGIDPLEIWELAQGEVTVSSPAWFAGLSFETPDVDRVAAMGRALLAVKTHFKFQPPNFEVYPAEVVERRLAEQAAARERELVVTAGQSFFHELWTGWASGRRKDAAKLAAQLDPAAAAKLKEMLKALLADQESPQWAPLWQQLRKGLPEHPQQPLILAQEWGLVPPHHNFLLDQAGYDPGDAWSEAFSGEIEAMRARIEAMRGEPDPARFLSVDSPTTRDIDDAFRVEPLPGGGWKVRMALARPTAAWNFESPLGQAVNDRATSLYLPEQTSHMLPEALGCGLLSLNAGQVSPALLLDWELDAQAAPQSFEPRLGWVRVEANLTYESVERGLESGQGDPDVAAAHQVAQALRAARIVRGAVILDRPEPKMSLCGPPEALRVELCRQEEHPKAQMTVSELMILANASIAAWAREREIPLLHRVQDVSIPHGYAGVWTSPVDMHRAVKQLSGATLEARPGRHASIAAEAYAPITSPLRRLSDLVNMAQVQHFLESGDPQHSREALAELLPRIAARLDAVGQVQRFRPRYWKLLFMQQNAREREFEAVVVEECGQLTALSLTELQMYVRVGREMLGGHAQPGQRFWVKLGKVDPLTNEFRVMSAREEEEKPDVGDWFPMDGKE